VKSTWPAYLIAVGACCLIVFSLLLKLGLGQLIDLFRRLDIVDRHLPLDLRSLQTQLSTMDLQTLRAKFPTIELPDAASLAERFGDMHWRFYAARFDLSVGRDHLQVFVGTRKLVMGEALPRLPPSSSTSSSASLSAASTSFAAAPT